MVVVGDVVGVVDVADGGCVAVASSDVAVVLGTGLGARALVSGWGSLSV